jgi:aminoglycoside phosphotransferase (APT) family kinase protein
VAGGELAEAGLADAERTHAAAAVGAFLRALHDPALVPEAGGLLPVDPMRRAEPAVRSAATRERLAHLSDQGLWTSGPEIERMLEEGDTLGPPAGEPVINHGDLHVRHVLVDRRARAVGVIDWGDLCLADPAVDLSLAYGAFAGEARAALLSAYGPVDAERAVRARALALSLCGALADYAADVGNATLLAESLAGMARSVAD